MLPMTSHLVSRTRCLLSQLASKSENASKAKIVASLPPFHRNRPRVPNHVNDNYCAQCATRLKDCVCVPGQIRLNPSPVTSSKNETVNLLVNSCVANAHSVTGLPQKKGINPDYCQNYTEIKYVKDVSCVGHLSSVNLVTNVATAAINLPVGARLHQFWEKWETLGGESKATNSTQRGLHPPLPVQTQPNQITNCRKQLYQPSQKSQHLSAGKQKCSRTSGKSKLPGVLQWLFWYPNPTTGGDLSLT